MGSGPQGRGHGTWDLRPETGSAGPGSWDLRPVRRAGVVGLETGSAGLLVFVATRGMASLQSQLECVRAGPVDLI